MPDTAPDSTPGAASDLGSLVSRLERVGVRRVHVLAWRDLDDPDAGGSEVHADEFMKRWAAAGLEVTHRTSFAAGQPTEARRNGYRVVRRGGRYTVFPRTAASELLRRMGPYDAIVEIWNGVPWFSPIWARRPNITFIHHVHGPMWDQIFPRPLSDVGRVFEARLAPLAYRRTPVVTPSESTREELLELGYRPPLVTSVPNGVQSMFSPGGERSAVPLVLAVGRLAPVKRYPDLVAQADEARRAIPDIRLRIVGDGPDRPRLEEMAATRPWLELPGRLPQDRLVESYRSAWVVASASLAEGWGLSLTEGAACGTPAVATDIRGHRCSVIDGESGLLVPLDRLGDAVARVLTDPGLRSRLGQGALAHAGTLSWDAVAAHVLGILADRSAGHGGSDR